MKTLCGLSFATAFFFVLSSAPAVGEEGSSLFQGWKALSHGELAVERGGESVESWTLNLVDLGADLQGNTVIDSTSGDNLVSGGAFTGAQGFSTIIQNTGNHVIIQNSTIVNLSITK